MEIKYAPGEIYARTNENDESDAEGKYILFGFYPQSAVKDEALISVLNALAGTLPTNGNNEAWTSYKYYIFDDNDKDFMWFLDVTHEDTVYRGVYFTEFRPNDTMNFPDENYQEKNGYLCGTVYWFRHEPIRWRILEECEGKAWILSDAAIDSQPYRAIVWDNSYVTSTIRAWLNSDFIKLTFNESERASISLECVTNPIEAEEDYETGEIKYGGGDTYDYIHLLSDTEASDMLQHGSRQAKATDYAICQGIRPHHKTGNPEWWLRSPYNGVMAWAHVIGGDDFCDFCDSDITSTGVGVRPALWLKL